MTRSKRLFCASLLLFQCIRAIRVGDRDAAEPEKAGKQNSETEIPESVSNALSYIPGASKVKAAASYIPETTGQLLEWLTNYLAKGSYAASMGIVAEDFQCQEGSGLGTQTTTLNCTSPQVLVMNPPPPSGMAMYASPCLMNFTNINVVADCNMSLVSSFVKQKVKNKAYGAVGATTWQSGYQGPALCKLVDVEADQPKIYYETASKEIDPKTGKALHGVEAMKHAVDKERAYTTNMYLWAMGESTPAPTPAAMAESSKIDISDVQIEFRSVGFWLNGFQMEYTKTIDMGVLAPMMGTDEATKSGSPSMKTYIKAIAKFVKDLVGDTIQAHVMGGIQNVKNMFGFGDKKK